MSFLYHLFIPNPKNDHRAELLKPPILSFFTLIFVSYQIFLNFFSLTDSRVLGYASNITPERIIELTNQKRASLGLSPLKANSFLSEAARRKAGDMFAFNYWAHTSPSGRDPWSFFKEVGYRYVYAGENLARDFRDPESVVEAWMSSPSHRENLVNSKYQEIGVAVVDGSLQGVETTLVVQLFGTQPVSMAKQPAKTPAQQPATQPQVAQKPAIVQGEEEEEAKLRPQALPQLPSSETLVQKQEGQFTPVINPFSLTKVISIFLVGVIFGAFLVDFILISEKHTPRLSGRSFAQMLFLGFILLLAIVSQQGVIL